MLRSIASKRGAPQRLLLGLALVLLAGCASGQEAQLNELRARAAYDTALRDLSENRFSTALASLRQAVSLDPEQPRYHNTLGLVHLDLKDLPEAMAAFEKAIALDPEYAEAHQNLGVALAQSGRYDEAIKQYQTALALPLYTNPDTAYYNLALAYRDVGRLKEAEDALRRALKLEPTMVAAYFQLGVILFESG
ncbi:MAG: tetratricopeptide repeat protein, partial [Candidatus Methylomirabilia bacterium]